MQVLVHHHVDQDTINLNNNANNVIANAKHVLVMDIKIAYHAMQEKFY